MRISTSTKNGTTRRRSPDAGQHQALAAEGGLPLRPGCVGDSIEHFFDLMELAGMLSPVWPPRELASSGNFRLSGNSSMPPLQVDMPTQSSLFDAAPPVPTDRLFLGIFPDASTAARIDALGAEICSRHGLRVPQHKPERLHITLFHIGDWAGLSQYTVDTAMAAAEKVKAAPFQIHLNEVASFPGKREKLPLVLKANHGNEALHHFRAQLGAELTRVGLGRCVSKTFEPHVTLAYAPQQIGAEPVEPVGWNASEFVLIHSLLGKTRHIRLGSWPLQA